MFTSITKTLFVISAVVGVLGLAGCATSPQPAEPATHDPALVSRYGDAVEAREEGRLDEAQQGFSEIADDYPDVDEARINLAILFAGDGDSTAAETLLEDVVARHPDNAVAWSELGILRRRAGRLIEADEAYQRALEVRPDYALVHRNRGVLLDLYLGKPDDALAHYQRYLELTGGDEEVEAWVTELRLRLGTSENEMVADR